MASPAVRVGILVFLAFLALILVVLFLRGYTFWSNRYQIVVTFDNALGMTQGAEVRMAGVPIGQVAEVTLDENTRARVVLDINRKYCIPMGSTFVIQSGLLIAQQFIEVIPNRSEEECIAEGAEVRGVMPIRVEELLPRTQIILDNLAETTADLKELIGDEEFQRNIRESARSISLASAKLNETMTLVQGTIVRSQDDIDAMVSNLRLASLNVRSMTEDLQAFVNEPGIREDIREAVSSGRRSAETIERMVASVARSAESIERTAASVERTAGSVESLVTDPQLQEDIRVTVSEARQAAEGARQAVERVNRFFGGGDRRGPYTRDNNLDVLYDSGEDRLRVDLATSLPLSRDRFLRLGIYDLGVDNHGILQMGQPLNDSTDLRYGIYASRLGVGLDHVFSPRVSGRLDLYDTEDATLDARVGYRLNRNLGMLLGVDDVFGQNEGTLGVQYAW